MAKEKSIVELLDEKQTIVARHSQITEAAKAEERKLTSAETAELGKAELRLHEINREIAKREQSLSGQGTPMQPTEKFSLRRAILNAAKGAGQHDADLQVMERAAELHKKSGCDDLAGQIHIPLAEKRAMFTAAAEAAKGVVIQEDQRELLLPLEANLVLSQAGARLLTGLQGNIYWPKLSDVEVHWEEENAAAKDAGGVFSKGSVFAPKRLTATASFSKQLLIQDSIDVEAIIRQRIAARMAQKIEQTAFSKEKLSNAAPTGIFYDAAVEVSGAMSWPNIVALETKMATNNALFGNLAYIMRPELRGLAKTKVKDASGAGGFVLDGNGQGVLNGYKALATTNMATGLGDGSDEHGIVFGNWADYFLGQWGALDIVVDPYSAATESVVKVTITMWANMGMIRPESFAIGTLK